MRQEAQSDKPHGLVVGNSCMSADVTAHGDMFSRILFNPSSFERGQNEIRNVGSGEFTFLGRKSTDSFWNITEHTYPRYRAETVPAEHVRLKVEAFSPIDPEDCESIFIPAVIVMISLENNGDDPLTGDISYLWKFQEAFGDTVRPVISENYAEIENTYLAASGGKSVHYTADSRHLDATISVCLKPHQTEEIKVFFGILDKNGRASCKFYNAASLVEYLTNHCGLLQEAVREFIKRMPDTGDSKLLEYTRWYSQAAILLTKSSVSGETITMGYQELNQRDSYWTSFLHVFLWPELEREIIQTTIRWQRPDGKIPTTVLPLIERNTDLDINMYFCLRVARFWQIQRDRAFLHYCYPPFRKGVQYLMERDTDLDGLPEQPNGDFWADWKDVPGVMGRKLAPHFCLLWLSVLKYAQELACVETDSEFQEECARWYQKAEGKINLPYEEGGLWNREHYIERWYDGRKRDCVLLDQTVGILFDVVPQQKKEQIYHSLMDSDSPYGIRETWPYREKPFEYPEGVYHNGGIWPYLSFVDCMGRYQSGRADEAEKLIKKVGYWDLEATDHWAPNEYLNGETGENMGCEVQGWSAALYGVMVCGAFGFHYLDDHTVCVEVRFQRRDFDTLYVLPHPFGVIRIIRKNRILSCSQPKNLNYHVTLKDRKQEIKLCD